MSIRRLFFASLLFVFLVSNVGAQTSIQDFAALLTPDPQAVLFSRQQHVSSRDILYWAVYFSGVKESEREKYMSMYQKITEDCHDFLLRQGLPAASVHPAEQEKAAEQILAFLFSGILKTYSFTQTRLDTLFNTGVYNCVSSAILYYALCADNGISVRGVKTPDHAFCAVTISGKSIDVETTNKYGFDPGRKKEFSNSFGQTGFMYVPPTNYRGRTDLSITELICLILQNRMAEAQRKKDFALSLKLAVDYNAVLQTTESVDQFYTECANFAALLDSQRQYEAGLDFLSIAALNYGSGKTLSRAADTLYHNMFVTSFPKKTEADWSAQIAKAEELYSRYVPNLLISEKAKTEALIIIFNQKSQELFSRESWQELFALLERAKQETGNNSRIQKLESDTLHNIGILFHNKAARLFNKGDKEGALVAVNQGLSLVPGNKTLINDLNQLGKAP